MGILALGVYGGWAWVANAAHGWQPALRAAATQGFASFTVTFFSTAVMEGVHRRMRSRWARFAGPAGAATAISAIYTVALHVWTGTPEVARTVVPVIVLGSLYAVAYSANLVRESSATARAQGDR